MHHSSMVVGSLYVTPLLISFASAQVNIAGSTLRSTDAFQWIQPVNTTILNEYGGAPPVYPSRKSACNVTAHGANIRQPT